MRRFFLKSKKTSTPVRVTPYSAVVRTFGQDPLGTSSLANTITQRIAVHHAMLAVLLLPALASASGPPRRPLRSPSRGQRSARMGGRGRPAVGGWGRPPVGTPTLSGVEIKAAGVIPFCRHEGLLKFFMQDMTNGSRVGQLCDFGGRSEADDVDLFYTAVRLRV